MAKKKHHPANIARAETAKTALAVYTRQNFGGKFPDDMSKEDLRCAIQDLMGDLMHLWNQKKAPSDMVAEELGEWAGFTFKDELKQPEM